MSIYQSDKELFIPIPGYEGYYEVSSHGKVKSLARKVWNGKVFYQLPERILKPYSVSRCGYAGVNLRKNGKSQTKTVHSLVLTAFKEARPEGMECRHYPDQNPANSHLINLSWTTPTINAGDKIINGTTNRGERSSKTKLTEKQVREIYQATGTQTEIARQFATSRGIVKHIKNGTSWKHLNLNAGDILK